MDWPMHEHIALVRIEQDVARLCGHRHAYDEKCHRVQHHGLSKYVHINSQEHQSVHQPDKNIHPENEVQTARLTTTRHRLCNAPARAQPKVAFQQSPKLATIYRGSLSHAGVHKKDSNLL